MPLSTSREISLLTEAANEAERLAKAEVFGLTPAAHERMDRELRRLEQGVSNLERAATLGDTPASLLERLRAEIERLKCGVVPITITVDQFDRYVFRFAHHLSQQMVARGLIDPMAAEAFVREKIDSGEASEMLARIPGCSS